MSTNNEIANYSINEIHSKIELEKLHGFVLSLVIKNEELADKYETVKTSKKAYDFLDAFYLNKVFPNEHVRQEILNSYIEQNKYYLDLYNDEGVDVAYARISRDYAILKYSPIYLDERETALFLELYHSTLTYFFKVLYTPAFKAHEFNREFITLMILFITMERYITSKMRFALDVDFFNQDQLENMFATFGLPVFRDLPLKYQRRLLKNINGLLMNKGTNKAIINIVNLFGFENIQLMKFYLVKMFNPGSDHKINWADPDLKFAKVPIENENVEEYLPKASLYDFEGITSGDPFWHASKAEIINHSFNYLETKYLGLEVNVSMLEHVMQLSYFVNMLRHLEEKCKNESQFTGKLDLLTIFNTEYSLSPIRIHDIVIALQFLILKLHRFVDYINYEPSSVKSVYGYNFEDIEEYAVNGSNFKKVENFDRFSNVFTDEKISKDSFVDTFLNNREYREAFENVMIETKNYKQFKEMRNLWKLKFTVEYSRGIFDGYEKYSDIIKENNLEFYNKLQAPESLEEEDRMRFYNNHINLLTGILDNYLDSDQMDFFLKSSIFTYETIKRYISDLIRIFKSYTIDLKDINILYLSDSRLFNTVKIFEESYWKIEVSYADFIEYRESVKKTTEIQSIDDFEYIDTYLESVFTKFFDPVKYKAEIENMYSIFVSSDAFKAYHEYYTSSKLEFGEFNSEDLYKEFYNILISLLFKDQITGRDEVTAILNKMSYSELTNLIEKVQEVFILMNFKETMDDYLKEKIIFSNYMEDLSRLEMDYKYSKLIIHHFSNHLDMKIVNKFFGEFVKLKDNLKLRHYLGKNLQYIQESKLYTFEAFLKYINIIITECLKFNGKINPVNKLSVVNDIRYVEFLGQFKVMLEFFNGIHFDDLEKFTLMDVDLTHIDLYKISLKIGKYLNEYSAFDLTLVDSLKDKLVEIQTVLFYRDQIIYKEIFNILDTVLKLESVVPYSDGYLLTSLLSNDDRISTRFNDLINITLSILGLDDSLNYTDKIQPKLKSDSTTNYKIAHETQVNNIKKLNSKIKYGDSYVMYINED